MKKRKTALLFGLLACASLVLLSCGNDDGDDASTSSVLTATVDGVAFTSISTGLSMQGDLTLVSGSNGGMSITFTITGVNAGTYDLSLVSPNTGAYFPNSTDFFSSREGEIVITELTENSIAATFAFEATNSTTQETVSVTNGSVTISN